MPKSKRDRVVPLTQTKKKGMAMKEKLVDNIVEAIAEYSDIYVITVDNMRNNKFKELREEMNESKFFFGKNKVMAIALGNAKDDEKQENLHMVSERLEPLLRKLGLTTKLVEGVPTLLVDTTVCKKGDILTPEQCKLLEMFGIEMAVMRVRILAHWRDGEFEELDEEEVEGGELQDEEDDNME